MEHVMVFKFGSGTDYLNEDWVAKKGWKVRQNVPCVGSTVIV